MQCSCILKSGGHVGRGRHCWVIWCDVTTSPCGQCTVHAMALPHHGCDIRNLLQRHPQLSCAASVQQGNGMTLQQWCLPSTCSVHHSLRQVRVCRGVTYPRCSLPSRLPALSPSEAPGQSAYWAAYQRSFADANLAQSQTHLLPALVQEHPSVNVDPRRCSQRLLTSPRSRCICNKHWSQCLDPASPSTLRVDHRL